MGGKVQEQLTIASARALWRHPSAIDANEYHTRKLQPTDELRRRKHEFTPLFRALNSLNVAAALNYLNRLSVRLGESL